MTTCASEQNFVIDSIQAGMPPKLAAFGEVADVNRAAAKYTELMGLY